MNPTPIIKVVVFTMKQLESMTPEQICETAAKHRRVIPITSQLQVDWFANGKELKRPPDVSAEISATLKRQAQLLMSSGKPLAS